MALVLIVDDALDVCRVMTVLLRVLGHEGQYVLSGQKALDSLQGALPDLIILDVMMPGMDGADVLRAIRSRVETKDIPVVMYSALPDPDMQSDLLNSGANDYWIKGNVDPDFVQRRIDALLNVPKGSLAT